jgi:hypothetical protein
MELLIHPSYDPFNFPQERHNDFCKKIGKEFQSGMNLSYKIYSDDDPRYQIFLNLHATWLSAQVFSILMDEQTTTTVWWTDHKNIFNNDFNNAIVKEVNNSLRSFIDFSVFHSSIMFVEDFFRQLLRSIDPASCNFSTEDFENVHKALFKKLALQQYSSLIDLFRTLRNTIHNNGCYLPRNRKDKTILYNGKAYEFKNEHTVYFTAWGYTDKYDFYHFILSDLNKLLVEMVQLQIVRQINKNDFFSKIRAL